MLQAGQVDRIDPLAPRGRGGRAAGLPARRHEGEGRSLSAPALRRAVRHAARPSRSIRRMATGEIEVAPLAFMRGRTLAHAFVILDEAQNTTPVQMKMFLTRMGEGTRMVVTGDPTQVDLPTGVTLGPCATRWTTLEGVAGHRRRPLRTAATWCAIRSSAALSRPMTSARRRHGMRSGTRGLPRSPASADSGTSKSPRRPAHLHRGARVAAPGAEP